MACQCSAQPPPRTSVVQSTDRLSLGLSKERLRAGLSFMGLAMQGTGSSDQEKWLLSTLYSHHHGGLAEPAHLPQLWLHKALTGQLLLPSWREGELLHPPWAAMEGTGRPVLAFSKEPACQHPTVAQAVAATAIIHSGAGSWSFLGDSESQPVSVLHGGGSRS